MTDQTAPSVDLTQAGQFVDRAIHAAVAPDGMTRPGSMWSEPTPLAGLHAALAVAAIVQNRVDHYAVLLRGEGTPWTKIADLLRVPYSDDYVRKEHAFEMVADPAGGLFDYPRVYWRCGGPLGCGEYIADQGPYESHPADNENGHADGCRRLAAEITAHRRDVEERERRAQVSQAAFDTITDPGDRATVERCWWSLRRGGEISGKWSHTERLAVALVLQNVEFLRKASYTRTEAIRQVYDATPDQVRRRLSTLRAAATGQKSR